MILEVGLNHLGDEKKALKYLDFFLNSNFKKLTFQINTKKYYSKYSHRLTKSFYKQALLKAKKRNKKIGLAVCDPQSFKDYSDIKFDFYKLLSIGVNSLQLVSMLNNLKKEIYISLGIADDLKIKDCLKNLSFIPRKKIHLIYTSLSYDPDDLNLNRIKYLKKKFKLKVGYGHHYKNILPLLFSDIFDYDFIFTYIKSKKINLSCKNLPDNKHSIDIEDLNKIKSKQLEIEKFIKNKKKGNLKIKIYDKIYL
jgi:sialic acid synthase SpsE